MKCAKKTMSLNALPKPTPPLCPPNAIIGHNFSLRR